VDSEHLTVEIEGRKALPVRAIPYVTGWGVGELVQYLSRKVGAPFERLQEVYAYHLISGQPVKYLPREWESIKTNLDALSAELHEKFKNDDQGYAAWCSEAVKILPEGVFVWVDEFEKDCSVNLSPKRILFNNERDGDRELNYTPHLTTAIREMVFAGFNDMCRKNMNQLEIHNPSVLVVGELTKENNALTSQAKTANKKTPIPRQRFQEEEILRVINELGFKPQELPKWEAGKPGVKARVRKVLVTSKFPIKVFDKAWERLRAEGNIKE